MLSFSVRSDVKQVERYLTDLQKKQLPFATAKALTQTAWDATKAEAEHLHRHFDRPTPFTLKCMTVRKATKRNPIAIITLKPKQADYLGFQIQGGVRLPERRAIPVPVNIRLNKYGNRPRRIITRLLQKDNVFSGQPKGHPHANEGIYQRPKRGRQRKGRTGRKGSGTLKLLLAYRKHATYRPRWPFHKNLARHAARIFPVRMKAAIEDAIRTAK